jgi:hypothetical protein
VVGAKGSSALQANWRWKLGRWMTEDRAQFKQAMVRTWQAQRKLNPDYKPDESEKLAEK